MGRKISPSPPVFLQTRCFLVLSHFTSSLIGVTSNPQKCPLHIRCPRWSTIPYYRKLIPHKMNGDFCWRWWSREARISPWNWKVIFHAFKSHGSWRFVFESSPKKQNKNKQEQDFYVEPVLMINTLLNLSSKGVSRSLSGALVIVKGNRSNFLLRWLLRQSRLKTLTNHWLPWWHDKARPRA